MQIIDVATAPRTLLLEELGHFSTNELRGIVAQHEADKLVHVAATAYFPAGLGPAISTSQRVALEDLAEPLKPLKPTRRTMNGTPGPARRLKGHASGAPVKRLRSTEEAPSLQLKILEAVHRGARSRGEIQKVTGATRHQAADALADLRARRSIFMRGNRRFARYALTVADAEAAHREALGSAGEPARAPRGAKTKRGRAKARASKP